MRCVLSVFFAMFALCLSSLATAQVGTTLLVKTDMNCNWKLDGQPMGLLTDSEPKVVFVASGEHLVEATSTVGATLLHLIRLWPTS